MHGRTGRRTDFGTKLIYFFSIEKSVYNYALCVTVTVIEDPFETSAGMSVFEASYQRAGKSEVTLLK